MKKELIAVIGIALMPIVMIGIYFLMAISGAIFLFNPNPPKPEITYGEFPITIIYEVNGETRTLEDTVICEFDGFENRGSAGTYRKWKSRLKSGNERLTLLRVEEENITFEITTTGGFPEYYMGDFRQSREEDERIMMDDRYLGYVEWKNGVQTGVAIPKEEVFEKYNLRILDTQFAKPIENSFK